MSLNLSRGKPLKYASSNRIASYMGNGILTFINEKVKFQEIFSENEMVFYKNENDLIEKINDLKNDMNRINKISKKEETNILEFSIIKLFLTQFYQKYFKEHLIINMHGKNKTICIAGKNDCAIKALSYVIKKYRKYKILALPNKTDNGIDNWQKSLENLLNKKNRNRIFKLALFEEKIYIYFLLNTRTYYQLKNLFLKIFIIFILVYCLNIEDVTQIIYKLQKVKKSLVLLFMRLIEALIQVG